MRKEIRRDLAVSVVLLVVCGAAVAQAWSFSPAARMLPLLVGVPTTALLVAVIVRDVRRRPQPAHAEGGGTGPAAEPSDRSARPFLVLAVLAILWLLFGYAVGAAAFTVWFMRGLNRESWRTALLMAGGTVLFLRGVLVELLGVAMYQGMASRYIDLL